jgi:hypothetical protein
MLKPVEEQLFDSSVSAVRKMAPAGQLLRCAGDISNLEHANMGGKLLTAAVAALLIFPIGPNRQLYLFGPKDSRVYKQ